MTARIPAHRRKRHPLDRQVLGVYRPPPEPLPDCAATGCEHPWRAHRPRDHGTWRCLQPDCPCLSYRPGHTDRAGEDT